MSNTIPLPRPIGSRPHESLARAWVAAPAAEPRTLRRWLRETWAEWRAQLAQRATRRALLQLDDRTLRDLGIVRAEVESMAAEAHGGAAATRARLLWHAGRFGV